MEAPKPVVAYFYDQELGNFCLGGGNPMRPHRVRLTNSLVNGYGLTSQLQLHRPRPRSYEELTEFHADDYVDFLASVTPANQEEFMTQLKRFNMGLPGEADCPVFDGVFEYCQMYSGGSVDGAASLAREESQICLNWSGGMHHAKKAEASGFCYINDIVLAILELLKVYQRVLYIDVDIHHGDGVEEAFYLTDRVMTVSFHKYGDFFPGTGALGDVGYGRGKHYAVNVPLHDGIDDESYRFVYEPIMEKVMALYQPGAVVMCCGADSLSGDRLGCFNLSLQGHSNCIEFIAKSGVPLLVLGGGGYTLRNVARCWTYETGRLMGVDLPDSLPQSSLADFNYYVDSEKLRIAVSSMRNVNTRAELEAIRAEVLENLGKLPPAPSAPMKVQPPLLTQQDNGVEDEADVRGGGQHAEDRRIVQRGDASDDEGYDEYDRHGSVRATWRQQHEHMDAAGASASPARRPAQGDGADMDVDGAGWHPTDAAASAAAGRVAAGDANGGAGSRGGPDRMEVHGDAPAAPERAATPPPRARTPEWRAAGEGQAAADARHTPSRNDGRSNTPPLAAQRSTPPHRPAASPSPQPASTGVKARKPRSPSPYGQADAAAAGQPSMPPAAQAAASAPAAAAAAGQSPPIRSLADTLLQGHPALGASTQAGAASNNVPRTGGSAAAQGSTDLHGAQPMQQ